MDIYEAVTKIVADNESARYGNFFRSDILTDDLFKQLATIFDKSAFTLLLKITTIHIEYDNDTVVYSPAYMFDNKRSFSIQDLSESDYELLGQLDLSKLPDIIAVRIADILWTEKKDYRKAACAIEKSHALYHRFYDEDTWPTCYSFISHAIGLSAKTGSKLHTHYLQEVYDNVIAINGNDQYYLSLKLIELLIAQGWKSFEKILPVIDNIISNSAANVQKGKSAFSLKTKILYQQHMDELAMENNRRLAKYLEDNAFIEEQNGIAGLTKSEKYLMEAIHLYRNNSAPEEGERVLTVLNMIQRRISEHLIPATFTQDVTEAKNHVDELFHGRTFKQQIRQLLRITPYYTKESIRQKVLADANNPMSALFGSSRKTAQGQTIVELPPIDLHNPEGDSHVLEQHMHQHLLHMEQISGETSLKWALDIIQQENKITELDLDYIVFDNAIIPPGREKIFRSALYHGMIGNLYLSLHILAPQFENLFRQIASSAGALTTTLKPDNTSDAKTLSSIFELPELIDCYDNNLLFLFQGLMNEHVGANIRNEIAHGLMSEAKGNDGAARFFFCWVLKLLALTARNFYEIDT